MYIHRWAKGDVLVWDNCSTVHQGVGNYRLPQRRLMYRTIVKGTEPF
jgi:taurine dioxygenase